VIVKKKLNKGPKLEELEDRVQDKREGRHLLFMQDIFLQLQCLTNGCSSQPSRAEFCCVHNVNLACCVYRNLYTAVDDWRPIFGVPQSYRPPTSLPPYNEHHEHHEHTEHHEYYEHSHQGGSHQHNHHHENDRPSYTTTFVGTLRPVQIDKAGSCPHPDSGFWEQRTVLLHRPNIGSDCSHDSDCSGERKCCHARVARDRLLMTCRLPEELYRPLYRPQGDPIRPSYYPTHEESYRPSYRPPIDDNYRPSYRPPLGDDYRPQYRPPHEDTFRPNYRPWRTGEIQLGEDERLQGLHDEYIPTRGLDDEYIPIPEQLLNNKQTPDDSIQDPYLESLMSRAKTESRSDNWSQLESREQVDNHISDEKIAEDEKRFPQLEDNDINEEVIETVSDDDSGSLIFPE